jgi:hypothetical protein
MQHCGRDLKPYRNDCIDEIRSLSDFLTKVPQVEQFYGLYIVVVLQSWPYQNLCRKYSTQSRKHRPACVESAKRWIYDLVDHIPVLTRIFAQAIRVVKTELRTLRFYRKDALRCHYFHLQMLFSCLTNLTAAFYDSPIAFYD